MPILPAHLLKHQPQGNLRMSYTQDVSGWILTLDPESPTAMLIARLLLLTKAVNAFNGLNPQPYIPAAVFTHIGEMIANLHRGSGLLGLKE